MSDDPRGSWTWVSQFIMCLIYLWIW